MKNQICIIFYMILLSGMTICHDLNLNITQTRLFGGYQLPIRKAPHHVFLKVNGYYICGGSLITMQHVLTAAHCIKPKYRLTVVAGTDRSDRGGVEILASKAFVHPNYSMKKPYPHDIAVVRLVKRFQPSINISVARMPHRRIRNFEKARITGFGVYDRTKRVSNVLRTYSTSVIDSNICSRRLNYKISPFDICDTVSKGVGICNGDSGSGLISDNVYKELIGVVSAGEKCGAGHPSIYVEVFNYLKFIRNCVTRSGND